MRVKMRTIYASPTKSASPGQEIDLPEAEAAGLVKGGYATLVHGGRAALRPTEPREPEQETEEPEGNQDPDAVSEVQGGQEETATTGDEGERATEPPPRRRKKGA